MRALVIGNRGDADPGLIGARAQAHGYELHPLIREEFASWPDLDGFDLVMSLGSEWSVYWDHVQANVQPEIALLQEAFRRDVPVFGICFGSQLLAMAHGGLVTRSPRPEIGWFDVIPTEAGADLIDPGPWFEWHDDRWELPPGATLLAGNENAPQAFSIGRSFAVQFHPELTPDILANWIELGGAKVLKERFIDRDILLGQTVANVHGSHDRSVSLFDAFLTAICAKHSYIVP